MRIRPLLAVAAVVAALTISLAGTATASASCTRASAAVTRLSVANARATTLCLLNQIRRRHHLRALTSNGKLLRAATGHSRDMVRGRYFAHGNFLGRILGTGYASGAPSWMVGENIGWGAGARSAPARMVNAWMHSAPHRANILNGRYRNIGIGIVRGTPAGRSGGTYTTDFGTRR